MEQYGIEETKEGLVAGLKFGEAMEMLVSKGPMLAMPKMIEAAASLPAAMSNGSMILKEALDYSDEERAELKEFVKQKFDLENDKAEAYVEKGLSLAISLTEVCGLFSKPQS